MEDHGGLQKKLSEELIIEMILGTIYLLKERNMSTNDLKIWLLHQQEQLFQL